MSGPETIRVLTTGELNPSSVHFYDHYDQTTINFRTIFEVGSSLQPNDLIEIQGSGAVIRARITRVARMYNRGSPYCDIEGIVEEQDLRNPQTGRSSSGDPSMPSVSSQSIPLESPPPGMFMTQVICKWCERKFRYEIGFVNKEYFIDGSDIGGLVTCRACYSYQNNLDDDWIARENREPEKPKKKNLYSRKLRIRRKE